MDVKIFLITFTISGIKFKWKTIGGKCLVPKKIIHEGIVLTSIGINATCEGKAFKILFIENLGGK